MKTGDPRQAVVLVVVALAVVGVAVFRILPKSEAGPRGVADEAVPEVAAVGASTTTSTLRGDPFYHPKLESPPSASDAPEGSPVGSGSQPEATPVLPDPSKWGVPGSWIPGMIGIRPTAPEGAAPEETTGAGQQTKKTRKVVLNAVLAVATPFAYLSIDGDEIRAGVGGDLPGIGKVAAIGERAVTVSTARGKVVLKIGEAVEL